MNTEDDEFARIEREARGVPDPQSQLVFLQSLRDTLERPTFTHALALKNLGDALELVKAIEAKLKEKNT